MAQTIKLKRSSTAGTVPTTAQLALGELAINTTDGDIYIKKSVSGTESIVHLNRGSVFFTQSSSAPSSPLEGDMWRDDADLKTYIYYNDGSSSQWVEI
tara:strand:- start:735 stop:1028 length:294 start_codon:yes stop_codon:yes gene_type:complete